MCHTYQNDLKLRTFTALGFNLKTISDESDEKYGIKAEAESTGNLNRK
jgi:hypothetical protein